MATNSCLALQKSLAWCQGTPEYAGIRRRIYYVSKGAIVSFPKLPVDEKGRPTSNIYEGDFVLAADQNWKYIDILPDKSQLTSDAQGEVPSQTQLNKLTAVHPGVGEEASALSLYINNTDCVFIVEDMAGKFRVLGCELWDTKASVAQDNGQGSAGTTSTTLTVEAPDRVISPFYRGKLQTEDGEIDCSGSMAA